VAACGYSCHHDNARDTQLNGNKRLVKEPLDYDGRHSHLSATTNIFHFTASALPPSTFHFGFYKKIKISIINLIHTFTIKKMFVTFSYCLRK
jgi:hypothetical protein